MKQPVNRLEHDEEILFGTHHIDLHSTESDADWGEIAVAATTKQAAWRKAVRRLERLLKEAKKKAGME